MKTKKLEGTDIKQILCGMITNEAVCARIAGQWNLRLGMFSDPDADLIGGWCVDFLKKYNQAPNKDIYEVYQGWVEDGVASPERKGAVERKLRAVDEYARRTNGELTTEFVLDVAEKHFNKVRLKKEWDEAEAEIERGEVAEAGTRMIQVPRVQLHSGTLTKPAEDFAAWREAFEEDRLRPLISYPGKLDRFLGQWMTKGSLISFMGPDKSFKSFWLLDAAFRGLRARLRIGFFEAGDMTRPDVMQRMAVRATKRPMKAGPYKYPIEVTKQGEVESEIRECDNPLTPGQAFKAFRKLCRGGDRFRLENHPNSSIDVFGIESILREWKRTGWVADIVVIDYADILAPPSGIRESLDQIDATWRHLRRISQEFDCLLLTATQSSALAYKQKKGGVMSRQHFSGRKTKLAHVNGMVGLNVSDDFRKNCVTGVNWVVRRKGRSSEFRVMTVVGCLDIANPAILCSEK